MSWKDNYHNEIASGGQRFSLEWYKNHTITKELIGKGLITGRICDVACGLGLRALVFSQVSGLPVTGVDADSWAIEFGQKESRKYGLENDFKIGSFYELPCESNSFDTVLFIAGIEHAAFPLQVLQELFRIAAPSGRVVISVTLNDFHADPDHKSAFSEAGLRRILAKFGNVETWISDNIIYAACSKSASTTCHRKIKLIYADMRHPDTYTEYWDYEFQKRFELTKVNFSWDGTLPKDQEDLLIEQLETADVLHFGTGAVHLSRELLEDIRELKPTLHISKWWGDVAPERYYAECEKNSDIFDTIFLSVSNYIGQCSSSCTQIHLNSPGVRFPREAELPFLTRPWDVGLFANAYSEKRLNKIQEYLPPGRWNSIWFGDGSPNGRISRAATNSLLGLCRINLNITDPEHLHFRHWFSARVSNALAAGSVVVTSPIEGLSSVLGDLVLLGGDSATSWHEAIEKVISDPNAYRIKSEKGRAFFESYLSYDKAVDTMACVWGEGSRDHAFTSYSPPEELNLAADVDTSNLLHHDELKAEKAIPSLNISNESSMAIDSKPIANDLQELALIAKSIASARRDSSLLKDRIGDLINELKSAQNGSNGAQTNSNDKVTLLETELTAARALVTWYESREQSYTELLQTKVESPTSSRNMEIDAEVPQLLTDLYAELKSIQNSKTVRAATFFSTRNALWDAISPEFLPLKRYSAHQFRHRHDRRLALSDNLGAIPYREYVIPFGLATLELVSMAVRPFLHSSNGTVGIEIVSNEDEVLSNIQLPLSQVKSEAPTDFVVFPPLVELRKNWKLRVFVQNTNIPVVVYELIEQSLLLRKNSYFPFVSLI